MFEGSQISKAAKIWRWWKNLFSLCLHPVLLQSSIDFAFSSDIRTHISSDLTKMYDLSTLVWRCVCESILKQKYSEKTSLQDSFEQIRIKIEAEPKIQPELLFLISQPSTARSSHNPQLFEYTGLGSMWPTAAGPKCAKPYNSQHSSKTIFVMLEIKPAAPFKFRQLLSADISY